MSGFLNDEQIHATLEALDHEAEGYQARVDAAKEAGDKADEARYTARLKQVDAEKKRVSALVSGESPADASEA